MDQVTLDVLLMTAVSIGFLHTLIGVDHALPFVALGKARGWNLAQTSSRPSFAASDTSSVLF